MHGHEIALQDGVNHLHIREFAGTESWTPGTEYPETVQYREGTYSRVGRSKTEFEWDGWRSHE